jgi:hypothetical protein
VTVTTGAALAPDDEPVGAEDEDIAILVEAGTPAETGGSFVFVPHVIGGISLTVAPDVVVEGLPDAAPVDNVDAPVADAHGARPAVDTADSSVPARPTGNIGLETEKPLLTALPNEEAPAALPPVSRSDRVRAELPFTGPGLTGLGGVLLGCLVVGLGAAGDLALGGGLDVGFSATFLLGCVLVATALRTRALAVAVVLPPLLFAGGYALETKTSGQTSGRREMALDVATSLALHAPLLFVGTALAVAVVLVRVVVHLIRR